MHPSTYEYLKPTDAQIEQMARVRAAAKAYSDVLEAELPDGPDKNVRDPQPSLQCDVGQRGNHETARR